MQIKKVRWHYNRDGKPTLSDREGIATIEDDKEVHFCGNIFKCECGLPRISRTLPNGKVEYLMVVCGMAPMWQDWYNRFFEPVSNAIDVPFDGSYPYWR